MKEYIKNLSVGLAIVSFIIGIAIIIFNVFEYFLQSYVFNLHNAVLTLLIVIVLHGSAIIGKKILELNKEI